MPIALRATYDAVQETFEFLLVLQNGHPRAPDVCFRVRTFDDEETDHIFLGCVHLHTQRTLCCNAQRVFLFVESPGSRDTVHLDTTLPAITRVDLVRYTREEVNRLLGPPIEIVRAHPRRAIMRIEAHVLHFRNGEDVCAMCQAFSLPSTMDYVLFSEDSYRSVTPTLTSPTSSLLHDPLEV